MEGLKGLLVYLSPIRGMAWNVALSNDDGGVRRP